MKKGKKVVAIVMAVLMIVGIMPFTSFSGIFSSKANAEVVTAELPTTNKAAGETVVEVGSAKFVASQALNAKTYEAGKELKDKEGNEYNKSLISTSVNNTKVQMAGDSKAASARALGYLTTTEDQTITVVVKVPKGKKADLVTSDTDLKVPATKENPVEITTGIERVAAGSEEDLVQIYTIEAVAGKYYYFMGEGTNLELLSFSAKKGGDEARPDWSKVEAPVINEISQDKDTVKVTYTMDISNAGADNVKVIVKDSTGKEVAKEASKKCDDNKQGTVEIKLTASGTYTFSIVASRENEEDKAGTTDKAFDFLAPLKAASIKPVTGHGDGSATVSWEAVDEAESYSVSYKVTDADDSTYVDFYTGKETSATVSGLTAALTVKVVVSKIFIFCSCRSSDIVLYLT